MTQFTPLITSRIRTTCGSTPTLASLVPPQNRVLYHFCVAEYAQKKLIVTGGRFVVNHVVDEAEMAELPSRAVSIYSIEQDSWTGEA
eukprot:CAMPEP_0170474460 /NCGR_PEP_ID=MMETSP0123-20130129/16243_1 /TAXON_ID=182087 /ORGANISM="Favella ehrenbergii, Strain Fehren 1" /LENGTH=86 /DNA_ID=CAMNT_0010744257 /DNA_START=231 /DNA_END=491 /DNA_ORIENTATION=+